MAPNLQKLKTHLKKAESSLFAAIGELRTAENIWWSSDTESLISGLIDEVRELRNDLQGAKKRRKDSGLSEFKMIVRNLAYAYQTATGKRAGLTYRDDEYEGKFWSLIDIFLGFYKTAGLRLQVPQSKAARGKAIGRVLSELDTGDAQKKWMERWVLGETVPRSAWELLDDAVPAPAPPGPISAPPGWSGRARKREST
jgi:hypothetical protein